MYTNPEIPVAAFIEVIPMGNIARYRIIISGILLAAVYILIGLEKIHRTLVALVGAFVSLLFLTIISHTPSMARVIAFMDEGKMYFNVETTFSNVSFERSCLLYIC